MKKIILLIIILGLITFIIVEAYNKLTTTENTTEILFEIESGSSLKEISQQLEDNNILQSGSFFVLYTKVKGLESNIHAGRFTIQPNIELDKLLKKLQTPEQQYTKITIPEGYTLYQIANRLEENNLIDKERFLDIAKEGIDEFAIEGDMTNTIYSLEGYIYPDTYYIPKGFKEKEIMNITLKRFRELFTDKYRIRTKELGMNINEIITIASLIEREAANDAERKTIAGVIYNRLKIDMPLQIDASVIYGITTGERNINRLLYKDLEFESAYNTYKNQGLPPGPIASPGIASIEAALYPQVHNYLYYVLNDDKHIFSKTYNEHLKNKRKYIN